ncbi:hypothetical protein BG006_001079 [Podila minutissima]|uniref:Uncharacterized protein n=1 Tax=Podila minutissima TaxID=64525 RepID=A0A9P5SWH7_9FUNG|nr:hypothetical protein BG006_001079 [Podila minutissima]
MDSRDAMVAGLGISSPTSDVPRHGLTVNTKVMSPSSMMRQDRSAFAVDSPVLSTTADFNPEEFRINLMRQISDKLETGLDRHFSQLVSATLPLSPATSDKESGLSEEVIVVQLKKMLRNTTAELERVKGKNQELRETNHKLELQQLEATHQISRLQDFEFNNQFLLSRVKELESCASSIDSMETSSMNGHRHSNNNNQHIQRLMRDVAALTSERDALKIRTWELEKKPYAQQHQQRPAHFIDLENERNRLVEELGAKTVAMEELWNKNEALMVRAKEYEKRVWELEGQCSALEDQCAALPQLRADFVEMEARAVAADALVEKMQDMEGQLNLIKSLQDRIQELETTNAELDHSNWDLSERLNIANNQHALLTKEFESFRSKDKDGRRLEHLVTLNRELETRLQEQAKIIPDYKDQYERVSSEFEKVKLRLPQLEGQAKQVALLRSKTLQLEKQIKTMEELEPRLEEMQQMHERNLFLESELGELEQLRAREMELEGELEESKSRLVQLETNKTRMASFSGLKQPIGRARAGSVAQHNPMMFQEGDEAELSVRTGSPVQLSRRTSPSVGSDYTPMSPKREGVASAWPSGRSSMSMATNRMSTSSNTSSSTVLTNSRLGLSAPASPSTESEEKMKQEPLSDGLTTEPESFVEVANVLVAQEAH